MKAAFLLLLGISAAFGDPLDDDLDAAVWTTDGDWTRFETQNSTNASALSVDQLVWAGPRDLVANSTVVTVNYDSSSLDDVIGQAFEREKTDMAYKLDTFLDRLFGPSGHNTTDMWTFVSFITIIPLRCSEVHKVVSLFDAAMQEVNPDAQITSVAQRLGASVCSSDGVCPCTDARRKNQYTTRVMEVKSTSRSKHVVYPPDFPFHVEAR